MVDGAEDLVVEVGEVPAEPPVLVATAAWA